MELFFLSWQMEKVKNMFRNTKKIIPEFCDFFSAHFLRHKTGYSSFLSQDLAKMVHFNENIFDWIYKYLNGKEIYGFSFLIFIFV